VSVRQIQATRCNMKNQIFKDATRKSFALLILAALLSTQLIAQASSNGPVLDDGTPIRLRLTQTLTSETAQVDERVDFEVLDDVVVDGKVFIAQGSRAWGTVIEAQSKRRMGRGGKLNVNIDGVKLVNGTRVALRGTKQVQGGGHGGWMAAGMVGSALVFWPAAPVFLLMKGKEITVPKGHVFTVFVDGDVALAKAGLTRTAHR
jgi:hypothetical protein